MEPADVEVSGEWALYHMPILFYFFDIIDIIELDTRSLICMLGDNLNIWPMEWRDD